MEYSDKEETAPDKRRQEHPRPEGVAGRKRPQTRSNISTPGTTQSSLLPRIRPVGTAKLSRKQGSRSERNKITLKAYVKPFSQPPTDLPTSLDTPPESP